MKFNAMKSLFTNDEKNVRLPASVRVRKVYKNGKTTLTNCAPVPVLHTSK